jgi:hypothetical protein
MNKEDNMSEETVIYESGEIKITNLRAVFGPKTYPVANITSVENKRIDPNTKGTGFFMLFGIAFLLIGLTGQNWGTAILGAAMIGISLYISNSAKPSYAVSLVTAGGEVKAIESNDEATIKTIVNALNDAIVKKG